MEKVNSIKIFGIRVSRIIVLVLRIIKVIDTMVIHKKRVNIFDPTRKIGHRLRITPKSLSFEKQDMEFIKKDWEKYTGSTLVSSISIASFYLIKNMKLAYRNIRCFGKNTEIPVLELDKNPEHIQEKEIPWFHIMVNEYISVNDIYHDLKDKRSPLSKILSTYTEEYLDMFNVWRLFIIVGSEYKLTRIESEELMEELYYLDDPNGENSIPILTFS
jgi:hypothetical protein